MTSAIVPYLQKHFDLHSVLKIRTLHVSGLGEGMIDDQIGDLETLANPTVGLTAHSGVVDIRIAAKAESESEADGMIASSGNGPPLPAGRQHFRHGRRYPGKRHT